MCGKYRTRTILLSIEDSRPSFLIQGVTAGHKQSIPSVVFIPHNMLSRRISGILSATNRACIFLGLTLMVTVRVIFDRGTSSSSCSKGKQAAMMAQKYLVVGYPKRKNTICFCFSPDEFISWCLWDLSRLEKGDLKSLNNV